MKIYISSFYNVRFFTENIIAISTAGSYGWPYWLFKSDNQQLGSCYINKNNVLIGLKAEQLSYKEEEFERLTEQCQKDCPYKYKVPNCQFMINYYNQLSKIDFDEFLKYLTYVAKNVKDLTHYKGDPIIVLLVYESSKCVCAERPCLQRWFKDNNYILNEWNK